MTKRPDNRRLIAQHRVPIFPRFGPQISWRQRWHYGTQDTSVLKKRELPVAGHEIDHEGAHNRVRSFRSLFHNSMHEISVVLLKAKAVITSKVGGKQ